MKKVNLRLAFEWTCPECGVDHFERSMMPDLGDKELKELKDEQGLEYDSVGEFVAVPECVICSECLTEYITHDPESEM